MEVRPQLEEATAAIKTIDPKSLEREELGRDYNFKEAADLIWKIYHDLEQVAENADILRVPQKTEVQIATLAKRLFENIQKIQAFVLRGNESQAPGQYQQINDEIKNLYEEDLGLLPPLIERINMLKLNPSEVESKINIALQSVKDVEKIKEKAQKITEDIELSIKEVRDALGKEGTLISATDFKDQAKEHKETARKWFIGVIVSIVITVGLVILLFTGIIPSLNLKEVGNDLPRIIQITVFKFILLSIAYLLVHQTLKNYKINQHLYVLNRHRQLSLQVYPLMSKATNDQEQSNAIVAQASKAIFDPGTTGYLDGEGNPNPVNLTEVINKVVDKA